MRMEVNYEYYKIYAEIRRGIISNLEKIAYDYDHQEITQEHLLYSMLTTEDSLISRLFEKMEIDPAVFLAQVEGLLNKRPKVQGGNKYISDGFEQSISICREMRQRPWGMSMFP